MANYITTFGEIRGSVGGVTFFRNRGGICMRMRAVPLNPNTAAQGIVRNNFASLATGWTADLTETQRGAWRFFANQHPTPNKVGQMIKLSGQQMFVKLGARMLSAGLIVLLDPPVNLQVRPVTASGVASADDGAVVFEADLLPIPSVTEYVYVFAAGNVGAGVANVKNKLVFAGATVGDTIADTFEFPVPAKFGALIAGNVMHAEVYRLNGLNAALSPGVVGKLLIS